MARSSELLCWLLGTRWQDPRTVSSLYAKVSWPTAGCSFIFRVQAWTCYFWQECVETYLPKCQMFSCKIPIFDHMKIRDPFSFTKTVRCDWKKWTLSHIKSVCNWCRTLGHRSCQGVQSERNFLPAEIRLWGFTSSVGCLIRVDKSGASAAVSGAEQWLVCRNAGPSFCSIMGRLFCLVLFRGRCIMALLCWEWSAAHRPEL